MKTIRPKDGSRPYVLDHFISGQTIASLAPGASTTISIPVQADSMFTIVKTSYSVDIASASFTDSTRPIPLINVSITDTGSGSNLQLNPVPLACLAGVAGLPLVWPVPREFKGSSTIQITFTNFSAATTYTNIFLALIGFKTYFQ